MIICSITKQSCKRGCENLGSCQLSKLKEGEDRRHTERRQELATPRSYFIETHRLGTIEHIMKMILRDGNKRNRRVELNHIQQVLKTLKLIPSSEKVVGLALGCLDNGTSGLFVLCSSPHQIQGDVPDATWPKT